MPSPFFPLHEEEVILNRLHILMEDYGVYIPTDSIDMRSLVYLSDKAVKIRNDIRQKRAVKSNMGVR